MKKFTLLNLSVKALLLLFFVAFSFSGFGAVGANQQYYEIRIYHISDKAQEGFVDTFLKDAYIPALHRAGVSKVGVFKPVETDTAFYGKLVYVFIPFKTFDQYIQLPGKLEIDKVYAETGKFFLDAPYDNPSFNRYESILMKAFLFMPQFAAPGYTTPVTGRIYELRSYESATQAKAAKKIEMFNQGGEIALFKKLKFNAVFYGEVLAGSQMPNLMYMTTFSDMKSHDEHWKEFGSSPEWKKLSGLEEYKNTVSKHHIYLLHPTSYSDF
jgi:hypothetical protein